MLSLLEMSFAGSVLILVIVCIRLFLARRVPRTACCILWAVAVSRLLLPVRVPFPVSLYPPVERMLSPAGAGGLLTEAAEKTAETSGVPVNPALIVWAVGAAVLMGWFLVSHLRGRSGYRTSLPVEQALVREWIEKHRLRRPIQVRYSDRIASPLTYGVLWPVILLPKSMNWENREGLEFVLAHETFHIRRFDAFVKWLLAAALCLHWFNPFVWVLYVLANRDMELACDEAVVRQYGLCTRASYALTLVEMEERRSAFVPLANGFSKNALETRITAIMRSHPGSMAGVGVALLLVAMVTGLFVVLAPSAPASKPLPAEVPVYTADWEEQNLEDTEMGFTREQVDALAKALNYDRYTTMSIADFNRSVNAFLSQDDMANLESYERMAADLPEGNPFASFFRNTVRASLNEYQARLEEAYSGDRTDPEFWATAAVEWGDLTGVYVDYRFTYRILDQSGLTVQERDNFLQAVMLAAQNALENQAELRSEQAFLEELKRSAGEISNVKIELTGYQVESMEGLDEQAGGI